MDAAGLAGEVDRFNGFAAQGAGPDFGRGTLWFEGFTWGGEGALVGGARVAAGTAPQVVLARAGCAVSPRSRSHVIHELVVVRRR
jgi:hypothetical protein